MNLQVLIVAAIGSFDTREHGLQCVVVALTDRVELVVMAAGTLNCQTAEITDYVAQHVIPIQIPGDLSVERIFANITQRTFVPGTRRQKSQRGGGRRVFGVEHVASNLFLHKPAEGFVFVQGLDEIVTVRPGMFANPVLIVAVSFCKMSRV